MDSQKTAAVAHKVRAFVTGFIGIIIFAMGTTLFEERLVYRIPSVLSPVFDLVGNVGVAVAMLLIGLGLIVWGAAKLKQAGGRTALYAILAVAGLGAAIPLMRMDNKPTGSGEEIMQDMERGRQEQIDAIRAAERPDLGNTEADAWFDRFDAIYARFKRNIEIGDSADIAASEKEFEDWGSSSAGFIPDLDADGKYALSVYYAKLAMEWEDLRATLPEASAADGAKHR